MRWTLLEAGRGSGLFWPLPHFSIDPPPRKLYLAAGSNSRWHGSKLLTNGSQVPNGAVGNRNETLCSWYRNSVLIAAIWSYPLVFAGLHVLTLCGHVWCVGCGHGCMCNGVWPWLHTFTIAIQVCCVKISVPSTWLIPCLYWMCIHLHTHAQLHLFTSRTH